MTPQPTCSRPRLVMPFPLPADLYSLYEGWMNAPQAPRIAKVTGVFSIPASPAEAANLASAFVEYGRPDSRICDLTAAVPRRNKPARLAEINLALYRLRADRNAARAQL